MTAQIDQQYRDLWQSADTPPDLFAFLKERNVTDLLEMVSVVREDQRHRWRTDQPLKIEEYLARLPELSNQPQRKLQLAVAEFQARQNSESSPDVEEFTSRFSDIRDSLFSALSQLAFCRSGEQDLRAAHDSTAVAPDPAQLEKMYESFEQAWQSEQSSPRIESYLGLLPSQFHATAFPKLIRIELWWRRKRGERPQESEYQARFPDDSKPIRSVFGCSTRTYVPDHSLGEICGGRYRLIRVLGEGAFGRVYLATDEELRRHVAIKVPTPERFRASSDVEAYLAEARTVAGQDHPQPTITS